MILRRMTRCVVLALSVLVMISVSYVVAAEVQSPEVVKQQFDEVISRLDKGGDLLIVANMDGVIEEAMEYVVGMFGAMPTEDPEVTELQKIIKRLSAYLDKSGFYAVNGWGMSLVPREDGLNEVKSFLSRDSAAVGLPLWRACVGLKPRRLAGLDYMPKDTVLAGTSLGELNSLWVMIRNGIATVLPPEGQVGFNEFLSSSATNLNVSLDKLMASVGDESFYSLQLSSKAKVPLPAMDAEGKPIQIPAPTLLVGVAVKDSTLMDLIVRKVAEAQLPMTNVVVDGVTLHTAMAPIPLPFPLQPTVAQHNGMLLFGSQQQVIRDALIASKEKNGFASSAEFKKAFEGLSMENNGMSYVSPRFGEVVLDIQSMTMSMQGKPNQEATSFVKEFMAKQGPQTTAMIRTNWKSGVISQGRTSSSGRDMVMGTMMFPVGLMAGVAIPSFVNARGVAQHNVCINNLRQIDAAKEQWALAQGKANGDEVDPDGIAQYIKGAKIPVCPQGGAYNLGPLGADPTCTEPGHQLQ
ncbi:MAG: hypothetical protein ISS35_05980 [Kiritimatiellae bacterium]|nr:hypothetical protein [Kiritimatiellia bacterium]